MPVLAVNLMYERAFLERALECSEPHRAALYRGGLLVFHKVYHGMRGLCVDLGGCGVLISEHVAGDLYHGHLHSETDSEEGDALLPRVLYGSDLALEAPLAKPGATSTPFIPARSPATLSSCMVSLCIVCTFTLHSFTAPACTNDSSIDLYASCSSTYLPTRAMSRLCLGCLSLSRNLSIP